MKLVVGMLVKNEAHRYLTEVVQSIGTFADELVVIDDSSTDHSMSLIQTYTTLPTYFHRNPCLDFSNEVLYRKMLYQKVLERGPDWLMVLDADEIFRPASRKAFETLMDQQRVDVWGFRLYDMWNDLDYRADCFWKAHDNYFDMLVRVIPDFKPIWREVPQHCGRLPVNIAMLRRSGTDHLRIKHYGWSKLEDRLQKYTRYKLYDPEGKYGNLGQYESILDPFPNLIKWSDG
ncbi:MAG: glycosyltransferase family 2 protein [Desulfosporosinus sp.]|nr:glycosyltransferase family 2 protein [Desulfosporosinus sp.]